LGVHDAGRFGAAGRYAGGGRRTKLFGTKVGGMGRDTKKEEWRGFCPKRWHRWRTEAESGLAAVRWRGIPRGEIPGMIERKDAEKLLEV